MPGLTGREVGGHPSGSEWPGAMVRAGVREHFVSYTGRGLSHFLVRPRQQSSWNASVRRGCPRFTLSRELA